MRVIQAAVNAVACNIGIHSAAATSERNWSRELLQEKKKALRSLTNEDGKVRGERREEKLENIAARRNDASKKKPVVIDGGLMGRSLKSAKSAKKFVHCIDGVTVEDSGVTCAEACGEECCVGDKSCEGFTGLVAKDGSCDGPSACENAKIGKVSGGSCAGT